MKLRLLLPVFVFVISVSQNSLADADSCRNTMNAIKEMIDYCAQTNEKHDCSTGKYLLTGETATRITKDPYSNNQVMACFTHFCGKPQEEYSHGFIVFSLQGGCGSEDSLQHPSLLRQNPVCQKGSIIRADNGSVGEVIPLPGLGFNFSYLSSRVPGDKTNDTLLLPLRASADMPIQSLNIKIYNEVGTLVAEKSYADVKTNLTYKYIWSGLDAKGKVPVASLNYKSVLTEKRFGVTYSVSNPANVGGFRVNSLGLGGWSPDILHFYDANSKTLYRGDGSTRKVDAISLSATTWRIPEADASVVYEFDKVTGRHLLTRLGLTGEISTQFIYNNFGLEKITSYPDAVSVIFTRNSQGFLTSITSSTGKDFKISPNTLGYVASLTNKKNEMYEITYSAEGLISTFKKPNQNSSTFTYNSEGNLVKDQNISGMSTTLQKILDATNPDSEIVRSTSALGRVTTITNDAVEINGRTHRVTTYPSGQEEEVFKGAQDESVSNASLGSLRRTTYKEDPRFGTLAQSLYSYQENGFATTWDDVVTLTDSHNPFSIKTWTHDNLSAADGSLLSHSVYDGVNKTLAVKSSRGRTSLAKFGSYQLPIFFQQGNLTPQEFTYSQGLLTGITQGERKYSYAYTPDRKIATITDPLGGVTKFSYDTADRIVNQILPDGRVVKYNYTPTGELLQIRPPGKDLHQFEYGIDEQVSSYTPPLVGSVNMPTRYAYNLDRQLTSIQRPDGSVIKYNYDKPTGKLMSMDTPEGKTQFNYFPSLGLVEGLDSPNSSFHLTFRYNQNRLNSVTYGAPSLTMYVSEEDGDGLLNNTFISSATSSSVDYTYDSDKQLTKAGSLALVHSSPNGLLASLTLGKAITQQAYSTYGELSGSNTKIDSNNMHSWSVNRDLLGRITTKTERLQGTGTYRYDYTYSTSGFLSSVQKNAQVVANYFYDTNGNRIKSVINGVTTETVYDKQDRLAHSGVFQYAYNANGELTLKKNTLTQELTQYTYNSFGSLVKVVLPNKKVITYEVDPFQQRISKKINGVAQIYYLYNPRGQLVAEFTPTGALKKHYVYASKANVPDYFIQGGESFRLVTDHLGSPRMVINATSGKIVYKMDHDEFGKVTLNTSVGYLPFGFAGGLYDADTGLVHFGAREYDPEIGRWISKDPLGFGGGMNLYGYNFSDPVNFIDSNGKNPLFISGIITGVIGGITGYITAVGNHTDPTEGVIIGFATGFAAGSGAALVAGAAEGISLAGAAFASGTISSIFGFTTNLLSQQILAGNVDISQAGAGALTSAGGAALGTILGGGIAVDIGTGIATQPIDVGIGLLPKNCPQ